MSDATRTIRVRCTFEIEVEVPVETDDYCAEFMIEENGCPGTGVVGSALDRHIDDCNAKGICWACALGGENKIVSETPCPPSA